MQIADVDTMRTVRRELDRHQLDVSLVHISANRGVVHLTGEVRPMRGYEGEFAQEIHALQRCLRQRSNVREALFEWEYPLGYLSGAKRGKN